MRRLFPDNSFVPPQYPDPKRDMVRLAIAEAPGEDEATQGQPLVGGAGRWFNSILKSARIDRNGLTIINCIQCRPPKNIFPTDSDARTYISKEDAHEAVSHCFTNHVRPLINSRDWRRVDLFGDKPLKIVGGIHGGIGRFRGAPLKIERGNLGPIPAVATLHPAFIARDQTMFPVVVNDLLKSPEPDPEHYNPYPSLEDVAKFTARKFAFDIETRGFTKEILMVGLCAEPFHGMCVPFSGAYIPELKRIFRNATHVITHNGIAFDLPILREKDVRIQDSCTVSDTMLLHHLCFPNFGKTGTDDDAKSTGAGHGLEFLASQFSHKLPWKQEKSKGLEYYCVQDTDVTLQSFNVLYPLTKEFKLLDLYNDVQVPLAKICHLMHITGIKVDPNRIQYVREKILAEMSGLERVLPGFLQTIQVAVNRRAVAPRGTIGKSGKPVKYILVPESEQVVPWRSTTVKQRYLYSNEPGCLDLDPITLPKTNKITTGKMALDRIYRKTGNPAVNALRRLNVLDELVTTFAKVELIKVGRQYPNFNVHGTSTGRLSSSDPNLQNIPESARYMYVPSHPGWKLVSVDFSGIENRIQSFLAGDTERSARLEQPGFSEHKYLASIIDGVPMDQIEKSIDPDSTYSKAKHVVHGVDRGLGYLKASRMYDMPLKETRELFETWKKEIWPTIQWQNKIAEKAKNDGFLVNPFGRRAPFYTSNYYTTALSFLPQSSGADVIYRAMIGMMYQRIGLPEDAVKKVVRVYESIPEECNLLLQVHDELVFECAPHVVDTLIATCQRVMGQAWEELGEMVIPIGIHVGDSWAEAA
jgi:DNA polymerase-1